MNYCIDENYISRRQNSHHDDTKFKDEYQNEVYSTARFYLDLVLGKNILDIGCGSGYKLLKFFKDKKNNWN